MKLTKIQYKKLEVLMPIARNSPKISDCKLMHAMLDIIENGFKWIKNMEIGTQFI